MSGTLPPDTQDNSRRYFDWVFNFVVILLSMVQAVLLAAMVLTSLNSSFGFGIVISKKITWDIVIGIFFVIAVAYYWRLQRRAFLMVSFAGLLSYIVLRLWPVIF